MRQPAEGHQCDNSIKRGSFGVILVSLHIHPVHKYGEGGGDGGFQVADVLQ